MSKYVDMIGWDDAPHLCPPNISPEELDELEADMQPHQRDARRKGKPSLGAGAIYPIAEELLFIDPIPIPDHWERAWSIDPGWRTTAALVGAYDPDAERYYLTEEYYGHEDLPVVHSHGIKAMLPWASLEGAIDPSGDNVGNQKDGAKMKAEYEDLGLRLVKANNAVHAGLRHVLILKQTGRLKVFNTLTYYRTEHRLYRRDEKGKIAVDEPKKDHLMDCERYLLNTSGLFRPKPIERASRPRRHGEW